jgi:membrane-bound serine protease (ClpP class)
MILIEFLAPGAIFGTLGGMALIASVVMFALEDHSPIALLFYIIFVVAAIAFLIKFALWRIRKTQPEQSIYADASQEGYIASTYDKSCIGMQGVVLSDLKPGGYILVGEKKLQAISLSGYISKGTHVEIVDGQEESLLVIPATTKHTTKEVKS